MDYLNLRKSLAAELSTVPGVISVGLMKKNDTIVFLVAVNSKNFVDVVPQSYQGVEVVLKDLGQAKLYQWR